jgi:hypothetical protein
LHFLELTFGAIVGLQGAKLLVKKEGFAGLYSGFMPTLLRDVPELTLQVCHK